MVEVQSMMKRHQLLESDIANHDSIVKALTSKGEQVRLVFYCAYGVYMYYQPSILSRLFKCSI